MAVKRFYTDLDVSGLGKFTGRVSGAQAFEDNEFVTKIQLEDYAYLQSLNDDEAPVLAGSLDASNFSIINLNAITATGNIVTTGTIDASNFSGINTGDQDISGLLPLVAGNSSPLTGSIYGGLDIEVTDKAKHYVLWENSIRKQYARWSGAEWQSMAGMGIGEDALLNNTGLQVNGLGFNALNANTGDYVNGIGYNSLLNNSGNYVNGTGHSVLASNTGDEANGYGDHALFQNSGFRANGLGNYSLYQNSGSGVTGIGSNVLYFNDGDYNTALGSESFTDDHSGEGITNTTTVGANSEPTAANQIMLGDTGITRVTVGNINYTPSEDNDLVNKRYADNLSVDFGNYQEKQPVTFMDSVTGGGIYIDKGTEEVFITNSNDPTLGGFHGIVYVEKHKSLYASTRSSDTKVYRFPDVTDLSTYTEIDISIVGYAGGTENIVYDEVKDKLYCVMSDATFTSHIVKVWEINPITMSASLVIDYDTVDQGIGYPTFLAFEGFLYVATNDYSGTLYRFDLSDYSLNNSNVVGNAINGMHNIMSDGEKLYISSAYIWDLQGVQISRIDALTLFVEETIQVPLVGEVDGSGGFTDDGIVIGDYIYLGTERQPKNTLYRFNKQTLTDNVSMEVLTQSDDNDFWAITFEGDRIWYSGDGKTFGSLDINTLENAIYTVPFTNNISEMVLNGRQLLVAGFDSYPVNDTGYIGRTGAPYQIEELIRLDNQGIPIPNSGGDAYLAGSPQTFTGNNTFTQPLSIVEAVADTDATTKIYVDSLNNITIGSNYFFVSKGNGNTDRNILEIGDFVRGQWSSTIFWETARYLGGDNTLEINWTVYNSVGINPL